MKICWDNLEKIKYNIKTKKWYDLNGTLTYEYKDHCKECNEPFLYVKYSKRQHDFCSISCAKKGKNNPNKRPEVIKKSNKARKKTFDKKPKSINARGLMYYDTYAKRLYDDETRRHPNESKVLQVKCRYCGKWFTPKKQQVRHRLNVCEDIENVGNAHFYCSEECKKECPVYYQKEFPKGFKEATSREVQPELRQMVFERDNYICQKCGSKKSLHCHHIEGIRWEPLESADIDKCITLCKKCHKEVHMKDGCKYYEMRCNKEDKDI